MLNIALKAAYLAAIGLSVYTSGWLVLKADKSRITGALAACQFLVILWCAPQMFLTFPMTIKMKCMLYGISYIGISFMGSAWLKFVSLYSKRSLDSRAEVLIFGISAFNYFVFLTNKYHHLFYRIFEVEQVVYGPIFYVHMAYTYFCVLVGIAVVLKHFRKNQVELLHIVVILLAAAVPLGFNLLYITDMVKSEFDLTPPAFALSSTLMLLAVFRYDLLDVNTIAFRRIFAQIAEGVVVYNSRGTITYCNEAAFRWFGAKTGESADRLYEMADHYGGCLQESDQSASAVSVFALPGGEKLEMKRYIHYNRKNRMVAATLMFTDVGKYFELLEQGRALAVSNQKLAIEQERNRIAQEVHDTAGHTLTMIQSLLKLTEAACGKEMKEPLKEYLKQARELASGGIRELRCSINHLRQSVSYELVTQGVYQLAESVKELEVEVEIQGKDGSEYSYLSPVVYGCLREAITNCLRHASASHMDVILKFMPDALNLYFFDNGTGCEEIKEGNGLRGIRERVDEAGGQVRFLAESGSGFQIFIKLPVSGV